MSCPRLTTFILWLTGHNFRMANVKQAILLQATTPYYARVGLQVLRCPFFGILLAVCMPGLQVQPLTKQRIQKIKRGEFNKQKN